MVNLTQKSRLWQSLVALDQLVNASILNGWADETISARAYRAREHGSRWGFVADWIDRLMFLDPDHCHQAYLALVQRQNQPAEYRENTT